MLGMASQTMGSVTFAITLPQTPVRWEAGRRWKTCGYQPVRACFSNPGQEPIVREALKEPVAFLGGMFAGLLRLDLNEDPLREWVARTVKASGMNAEDISEMDAREEEGETPERIEIE